MKKKLLHTSIYLIDILEREKGYYSFFYGFLYGKFCSNDQSYQELYFQYVVFVAWQHVKWYEEDTLKLWEEIPFLFNSV